MAVRCNGCQVEMLEGDRHDWRFDDLLQTSASKASTLWHCPKCARELDHGPEVHDTEPPPPGPFPELVSVIEGPKQSTRPKIRELTRDEIEQAKRRKPNPK